MRCPWSSTVGRSAAMPAAPATASTNSPSAWPTGSSPFRPTPVEAVAVRSPRCFEPVLPVSVRTPLPPYSHQTRKSTTQHLLSRPLRPPNDFTISQCLPSAANSRQISALPVVRPPAYGIAALWVRRVGNPPIFPYTEDRSSHYVGVPVRAAPLPSPGMQLCAGVLLRPPAAVEPHGETLRRHRLFAGAGVSRGVGHLLLQPARPQRCRGRDQRVRAGIPGLRLTGHSGPERHPSAGRLVTRPPSGGGSGVPAALGDGNAGDDPALFRTGLGRRLVGTFSAAVVLPAPFSTGHPD